MCVCVCMCMRACMRASMCMCVRACMHIHTHRPTVITFGWMSVAEMLLLLRAEGLMLDEYLLVRLKKSNIMQYSCRYTSHVHTYLAFPNSSRKVLIWLMPMDMWQVSFSPSLLAMPLKMLSKLHTSWERVRLISGLFSSFAELSSTEL